MVRKLYVEANASSILAQKEIRCPSRPEKGDGGKKIGYSVKVYQRETRRDEGRSVCEDSSFATLGEDRKKRKFMSPDSHPSPI